MSDPRCYDQAQSMKIGQNMKTQTQTPESNQPGASKEARTRPIDKIGVFLALRANGWSLSRIARELRISKATAWDWDNRNQNQIHLLKHLQLEKLQEKYLTTYEEELQQLTTYLAKVEKALQRHEFLFSSPEFLLQMALQLRARLCQIRERVPLQPIAFNSPLEPLHFSGCITRQSAAEFQREFLEGTEPTSESSPSPASQGVH